MNKSHLRRYLFLICNYTKRLLYIIQYRYSTLIFAQSGSFNNCIYISSSESIDNLIMYLSLVLYSVCHIVWCEGYIFQLSNSKSDVMRYSPNIYARPSYRVVQYSILYIRQKETVLSEGREQQTNGYPIYLDPDTIETLQYPRSSTVLPDQRARERIITCA